MDPREPKPGVDSRLQLYLCNQLTLGILECGRTCSIRAAGVVQLLKVEGITLGQTQSNMHEI